MTMAVLYFACAVAAIAIVLALLVLSSLWGVNVLHLPVVDQMSHVNGQPSVGDAASVMTAIATASLAISTALALIVGSFAIITVVISQRAEFKTEEQLKVDVAALVSTLVSLRDRAMLYTNPSLIDTTIDIFRDDRKALATFLSGASGFALFVSTKRMAGEAGDLSKDLAGLIDMTTLSLSNTEARQAVLNGIWWRSDKVARRLAETSAARFSAMRDSLVHIGAGLSRAKSALESDPFSELTKELEAQEAAQRVVMYDAPSENALSILKDAAARKIGGKAPEVIEHFGRAAIDGSGSDRQTFDALIRQLFNIDLREVPESDLRTKLL
jgi:hypothetical protein